MFETDKMLLAGSLIDQMLDGIPPLGTFMRPEEYQQVNNYSKQLKSREWFLDLNFFSPLKLKKENSKVPFKIKLYADINSNNLSDTLAIIPFEFQYIKRDLPEFDVIILRMIIDSKRFRIATMEVSEDVISDLEENFKKVLREKPNETPSNIFDEACFLCVKNYVERVFRTKGNLFNDWNTFKQKAEAEMNISIKDYSDIGKYLWQTDYLCFDNRLRRGDKVATIVEQLNTYKKEDHETPASENIPQKKSMFSFKSFFGNKKD